MQLPQEGAVCLKGATGQGARMLDHLVRTPPASEGGGALRSSSRWFESAGGEGFSAMEEMNMSRGCLWFASVGVEFLPLPDRKTTTIFFSK